MVLPATASWHRCWHERGRKHATSQSCHAQAPAAALLVPVCTLPGSSTLDKLMHLVRSGDRRLSRDDNSPSNGHPHEWTSDFSQPLKIEAEEKKFRMSMLSSQASLVAKILAASCKMHPEALLTPLQTAGELKRIHFVLCRFIPPRCEVKRAYRG